MQLQNFSLNQIALVGALTLASLSTLAPFAQAQNSITPPSGWMPYGPAITMTTSQNGYSNKILNCSMCVGTQDQVLSSNLIYRVYKNGVPTNDSYDYYLLTGNFSQGVQSSQVTSNWLSVGIFGTGMTLNINGNGAYLMDYGPVSTTGSSTTGFSVGAGVGAGSGNSGNLGWSTSYTAPDTNFTGTADSNQLTIKTVLPGPNVGGDPNPKANAYGFVYPGAAVFRVRQGSDFKVSVTNSVQWGYTYPRGTQVERYDAWHSGIFQANFTDRELVQGASGQCLSIQGKALVAGQPVILQTCTGDASQKWSYTQYGQVKSSMTSGQGEYCMDTVSGSVHSNSNLAIMPCTTPVLDTTGQQTAGVKPSQILQLGQVWNYDEAPTTQLLPGNNFWACGVYSNTSLSIAMDPSCSGNPAKHPSNLVISSVSGAVPLGGSGSNLVITSGMSNVAGTSLYFHSVGAQTYMLKNAIESQTTLNQSVVASSEALYENSFFTLR